MQIEIISGQDEVKEIRDRETREIKGLQQQVFFHIPGEHFPVRGKMRVQARINPGKYQITPAYRIGKYGDLEINPFAEVEIKPATPAQVKSA